MVHIDCSYVIPAPIESVWDVLTHPETEHEHTWLMDQPNELLERRADGVRFRTRRNRQRGIGRPDAVSVFDGVFEKDRWKITWRITEGFERGSLYEETLSETTGGTRVRAYGRISLKGIEWDWRLWGTIWPPAARKMIERNICRDYKRIKMRLAPGGPE